VPAWTLAAMKAKGIEHVVLDASRDALGTPVGSLAT
jgi:hypothetical protein